MNGGGSSRLIRALSNPAVFGDETTSVVVIETHISWVLLTGRFAYKIKKPVNLGFLDFSTLDKRRRYCEEELRLNRRLAPEIYLDVVPVSGTVESPRLAGDGEPIEFAVKMRQFPQEALLSRALADGRLSLAHIDRLAQEVAEFHAQAAVAPAESSFGTPERIEQPVLENFSRLIDADLDAAVHSRIARLRDWSLREFAGHRGEFESRRRAGFVRECHGDMHLGNMILDGEEVVLFDCIEFNEHLRWIDVASEVAFCTMDLEDRGRADFARRFLNAYLEITGDYAGLTVLPFYRTYRALVRAKVAQLRADQPGVEAEDLRKLRTEVLGYLTLAERYTQPARPFLLVTHGFSGSGKTTSTQGVVETLGAIRVRSDVERKRLAGLEALSRTSSGVEQDLYSKDATTKTYAKLAELAGQVLRAGFSVIVDATFLKRQQRKEFRKLGERLHVPFLILDFQAREETLRHRVKDRARAGSDASEAGLAVLEHQLRTREPLAADELPSALPVDIEDPQAAGHLAAELKRRFQQP